MTEPNKTEQKLIEKIADELAYWHQVVSDDPRTQDTQPRWLIRAKTILACVKKAGWKSPEECEACPLIPGKFDHVVRKPITGLPQVGNFPPEEYQPILGYIPPEPWELTGYSGDRYLTVEGRKTILEDVYLARKARADWKALSPEERLRLEQEQEDRRTEE